MVGWVEEDLENVVKYRIGCGCVRIFVGLHDDSVMCDVILADKVLLGWRIGFINQCAMPFC